MEQSLSQLLLSNSKPKTKADEHFLKAFRLMRSELYQSAVVEFHQACLLARDTVLPQAKRFFRDMLHSRDYESALSVGMLIHSIETTDVTLTTELGILARRVGNNNQGLSLLKQAFALKSNDLYILANLGAALENLPYYDQDAVTAYSSFGAVQFVAPAYLSLNAQGEYGFVLDLPKKLEAKVKPMAKDIEDELAKVLAEAEQANDEAEQAEDESEEEALEREHQQKERERALAEQKKQNPLHEAYLRYFRLQQMEQPAQERVWSFNMCLYRFENQYRLDTLAHDIIALVKRSPDLPYIKVVLALVYWKKKEVQKAVEIFLDLLKNDRYNRLANVNLGLLSREYNKLAVAARHLVLTYFLLQRNKGSYFIEELWQYARQKFQAAAYKEARHAFEVLIAENRGDEGLYVDYITCLEKAGDLDAMLEAIKSALEKFPKNDALGVKIAQIYAQTVERGDQFVKQARYQLAIRVYKQALELDKRASLYRKILNAYEQYKLDDDEKDDAERIKQLLLEQFKSEKTESNQILRLQQEEALSRRSLILEDQWKKYMQDGLDLARQKDYNNALPFFESAFQLKSSQVAFDMLSNTYRVLKRDADLVRLIDRYKKIQLYEKKI